MHGHRCSRPTHIQTNDKIQIHSYIHIRTCRHTHIQTNVPRIRRHLHSQMHACTSAYKKNMFCISTLSLYIYIYIYMHIYIHIHIYTHTDCTLKKKLYFYIHTYVHADICIYRYVNTHICLYINTCIRSYI